MPAALMAGGAKPGEVISIDSRQRGVWSLLEVARPGCAPVPFAIILAGGDGQSTVVRARDLACFEALEEDEFDFLESLEEDLNRKGRELGGLCLLGWFEEHLSHFLRISDRAAVSYTGTARAAAERLFLEHVDSRVQKFVTHLPFYGLRAAATKFGEMMETGGEQAEETWLPVPARLHLTENMFVAQVVGRSMEPRIPDGSYCIFRSPVVGSRQGRLLLIEKFDEYDVAARYTVKKYARRGELIEGEERTQPIRLEPLNPEFEAFELESDQFRALAEFVQVLDF